MSSVPLTPGAVAAYDCVLVCDAPRAYDWQMIADHARLVVDTRGVMRRTSGRRDHIALA